MNNRLTLKHIRWEMQNRQVLRIIVSGLVCVCVCVCVFVYTDSLLGQRCEVCLHLLVACLAISVCVCVCQCCHFDVSVYPKFMAIIHISQT